MKRAAIYCRISDDREGRRLGVERQETDGRTLAQQLGYEVADVFVENDISASTRSTKKRPLFEQMVKTAEEGGYQALIAYSSSRLTRRPMESERLIGLYERHGVKTHYVNTNDNDLSTARGRRRARDDAARDAEYAEELSENVKRAAKARAEEGRANGGTRPYGWSVEDRRLLDPAENAVIQEMAARVLAGESVRSITVDLNRRGVPTVTGAPWSPTAVKGLLTNPRLTGIRVHNGTEVGRGDWAPALPVDIANQLTRLLSDPSRRISFDNRVANLLTGIALCGECGETVAAKVQIQKGRPPRPRYHCTPCQLYRSRDPIDQYVEEYIVTLLEHIENEPQVHADPEAQARVDALRLKIEDTQTAFAAADDMTPADLLDALRPLRARLKQEKADLKRTSRPRVVTAAVGPHARASWGQATLGVKRLIISELVEVTILRSVRGKRGFDPDSVTITRK